MLSSPGVVQEMHNNSLRAKRNAGLSALDATKGVEESNEWALFGYNAEDEADDWRQEWGLLRLQSKGDNIPVEPLGSVVIEQQLDDIAQ